MLIDKNSTYHFASKRSGGKGFNLYLLANAGINVPKFTVISSKVFEDFKKMADLQNQIDLIFKADGQYNDFKEISQKIENLILTTPLPKSIERLFLNAIDAVGVTPIAVRSSAIGEDSSTHSFAGQLSSFLFVTRIDDIVKSIKKCWASAYSERGLSYRFQNKLPMKKIEVAVILQEMIKSEKSGVAFSCDPISGTPEKMVINAVYGVGEGLVSGELDGDVYEINKSNLKLIKEDIAIKKSLVTHNKFIDEVGHVLVDVPRELQNRPVLSSTELKELSKTLKKIEQYYHYPQDIEWAFYNGELHILQSRPITTPIFDGEGDLYIWDNSNIVESYGGLTLPLTFDFARHVYHHVYVQFCEILLVPKKRIREMDYFLKNMLGIFFGRIYYNLLNWYKLTSILPGFKYNRKFMETMMGTNESLQDEIANRIKPPAFEESFLSKIRRFVTGLKFLYFHFTIQKVVDKFLAYFYSHYNKYKNVDFKKMDSSELISTFYTLEQTFLTEWKAPIINDYLCMVHFGLFKKLVNMWGEEHGDGIVNDLLSGDGNLESAAPTREIMRLTELVNENEPLKDLIFSSENSDLMEALSKSNYVSFYNEVLNYMNEYGFRCMSEMKLEQKDLHQNPDQFFVFLKNHLNSKGPKLEDLKIREQKIRRDAELKMSQSLKGNFIKNFIFNWSLKNARQAVRNRENTRFCRTRVYGLIRRLFYSLGADFARRGIIHEEADVFYLTFPELFGALEGTSSVANYKDLINLRKNEYEKFKISEVDSRFMTRGPTYWQNKYIKTEEVENNPLFENLPENAMMGIPCSAGIIEGTVKVILSPDDDLSLNGEILVTERTDPGWVPLYPSAKGLLVERGGLLSHSAIVAREMGLPTIVSIKGLTKKLKTGMIIRMNGESGLIEILKE